MSTPPPAVPQPPSSDPAVIMPPPAPMDPIVPLVVAIFLGGIAYFFYGQWQKGIAALVLALIIVVGTCGLLSFLALPLHVAIALDAYFQAKHLREGRAIRHWTFFDQCVR